MKSYKRNLWAPVLAIMLLYSVLGECTEPTASLLSQAIALHARAHEGDGKSAEKAAELFKTILKSDPKNAVATAYLGSAYTLMGRHADVLIDKVRYTNRGIRFLDQALEQGSDDFTVRLIRANVNLSLPEMFKRAPALRADMEALDRLYEVAPSRERAQQLVPLYAAFAKKGGGSQWDAKSHVVGKFAAK